MRWRLYEFEQTWNNTIHIRFGRKICAYEPRYKVENNVRKWRWSDLCYGLNLCGHLGDLYIAWRLCLFFFHYITTFWYDNALRYHILMAHKNEQLIKFFFKFSFPNRSSNPGAGNSVLETWLLSKLLFKIRCFRKRWYILSNWYNWNSGIFWCVG